MRLRTLAARLRGLFLRRRLDAELSEELKFHLDMQTEQHVRRGVSPDDARRRAIRDLGGVDRVTESHREVRGFPGIETVAQDLRYGIRMLRRHPGYTAVAVVSLALCIGANTAIFSVLHAALLRPLPYPDGDRVVTLFNVYPAIAPVTRGENSVPDYLDRAADTDTFESLALLHFRSYNIGGEGAPVRVSGVRTTPTLFDVLRVQPELGRPFTRDESEPGNDRVVILGHGLWTELFGGSPSVLGQTLQLDGIAHAIVGVMPEGFELAGRDVRLIVAWAFTDRERSDDVRHGNFAEMLGRLRPGVTVAVAQERIDAINTRNLERFPVLRSFVERTHFTTVVIGLQEQLVRFVEPILYLLQASVLIVLMIGCVNIANLQLIRATARARELAVRLALGAGRVRVVRQLITESLLLAALGGAAGLLIGQWGTLAIVWLGGDALPVGRDVGMNATVVLFTLAATLTTGIASGAAPALQLARSQPEAGLRSDSRTGSSSRSASLARSALVVAEVSLAFVVLIGAGLLLTSFQHVLAVDPGFRPARVLSARVSLPETRYGQDDRVQAFTSRAREALGSLPGVLHVGVTTLLPFGGVDNKSVVTLEGHELTDDESLPLPHNSWVSGAYFEALGIPLVEGRGFEARDDLDSPGVAIVDREFADRYWPDGRLIGRRLHRGGGQGNTWLTVVGVVGTAEFDDLADDDRRGTVYFAHTQPTPRAQTALRRDINFVIQSQADAAALTNAVRTTILGVDPALPVYDVKAMETRMDDALLSRRAPMTLVAVFAALALLLSVIGIYGVIAHTVSHRTREIGIRLAMGAERRAIVAQVLWQAIRLVSVGLTTGMVAAVWLGGLIEGQLYQVRPSDPAVFAIVSILLFAAAVAAGWIPSRRASRVNVVRALRAE